MLFDSIEPDIPDIATVDGSITGEDNVIHTLETPVTELDQPHQLSTPPDKSNCKGCWLEIGIKWNKIKFVCSKHENLINLSHLLIVGAYFYLLLWFQIFFYYLDILQF